MRLRVKCCLIVFISLFFTASSAFSQGISYVKQVYSDDYGIPQHSIENMLLDKDGFLWFGTQAGLVRFDGSRFKTWEEIGSQRIGYLFRSRSNPQNFVGFTSTTLKTFSIVNQRPKYLDSFTPIEQNCTIYNPIFRDLPFSGPIILAGFRGYFYRLDTFRYALINTAAIHFYYKDRFYGTYKFSDSEVNNSLWIDRFRRSLFIFDRALYYMTDSGNMFRVVPGRMVQQKLITANGPVPRHALVFENRFLYNRSSIFQIDSIISDKCYCRQLIADTGLNEEAPSSIAYDVRNNITFLGSSEYGLFLFRPSYFRVLTNNQSIDNIYYSLCEYEPGKLLTTAGPVFDLKKNNSVFQKDFRKYSDRFGCVLDKFGRIWMRGGTHVNILSAKDFALQKVFAYRANSNGLFYDSLNNNIYLGIMVDNKVNYLYRYHMLDDGSLETDSFRVPFGLVQNIFRYRNWLLCSTYDGLYRFDINTHQFTSLKKEMPYFVRSINDVSEKRDQSDLWITTDGNGIFRYRNGRFSRIATDRLGYLKNAHAILRDKKGYLWISCNKGLVQVRKSDWERGDEIPAYCHYYNKEDGILTNEFNGAPSSAITLHDGTMAFASIKGIVVFNPNEIVPYVPDGPLIISQYVMGGHSYDYIKNDTIRLEQHHPSLKITLSTPFYGNHNNLNIYYKINNNPFEDLLNNALEINGLPVGYNAITFVKLNGFGRHNMTNLRVIVYVPPKWYQTAWFYVGAGIAVWILVYLLIYLRFLFLKRQNEMLSRQVAQKTQSLSEVVKDLEQSETQLGKELVFQKMLNNNIIHNIKTPINYLSLSLKNLSERWKMKHREDADMVKQLADSATDLNESVTGLLNFFKLQSNSKLPLISSFDLSVLLKERVLYFNNLQHASGTLFFLETEEPVFLKNYREFAKQVLINIFDNIYKYSEAQQVIIRIDLKGNATIVTFKELNGKGIEPDFIAQINAFMEVQHGTLTSENLRRFGLGFMLIRQMLPYLKATFRAYSEIGKGSVFELIFLS